MAPTTTASLGPLLLRWISSFSGAAVYLSMLGHAAHRKLKATQDTLDSAKTCPRYTLDGVDDQPGQTFSIVYFRAPTLDSFTRFPRPRPPSPRPYKTEREIRKRWHWPSDGRRWRGPWRTAESPRRGPSSSHVRKYLQPAWLVLSLRFHRIRDCFGRTLSSRVELFKISIGFIFSATVFPTGSIQHCTLT